MASSTQHHNQIKESDDSAVRGMISNEQLGPSAAARVSGRGSWLRTIGDERSRCASHPQRAASAGHRARHCQFGRAPQPGAIASWRFSTRRLGRSRDCQASAPTQLALDRPQLDRCRPEPTRKRTEINFILFGRLSAQRLCMGVTLRGQTQIARTHRSAAPRPRSSPARIPVASDPLSYRRQSVCAANLKLHSV